MPTTRRSALLGLTAAWTLGHASLALAAAPTDRRLVVVILRGALDGLAAVVPYGDPNLAAWRGDLVPPSPGQPGGMHDLGGFFGLHPALTGLHAMYAAGELLPVHAVAGPYRSRSHFDAQDYLESGADHRMESGWLNHVVAAMPPSHASGGAALAVGMSVPLLLRGPAGVGNWAPDGFGPPPPELYARIAALNHDDPLTGKLITEGLSARGVSATTLAGLPKDANANGFAALAAAAGRLLAAADGPRIAALEAGGWDTHAAQAARLTQPLRQLDDGLAALRKALGPQWAKTAVLVVTEFGRTVRINGTLGTDHGTASVAFVLGGAVAGGRVAGVWPGLAQAKLLENRDLAPTTDVRSVAQGLLVQHLGLGALQLDAVFPGGARPSPMGGLIRPSAA